MLGLGESHEEILETIEDLASVGVDILTMGQYLQPSPKHLPVAEFVTPERFEQYKEIALSKGFRYVESGPLVRSSYHAEKHLF
jgi:lipoic acid synthetase